MAVVKIIELVGSSKTSSDDAAKQALSQAQSSLRNIRAVDIVSTGIRGENLDEYRAHVRVAFLIEGPHVVGEWPLELHGPLPAGGSEVRIGVVGGAELDRVGQLERIETRGNGAVVDCQFNRSLRRRAASSAPSMATPGIPIGI